MQVLDNIDTRKRETRAFVKLNNFIPNAKCILITNSEEAVIDCDGINIEVIPIWIGCLITNRYTVLSIVDVHGLVNCG